MLQTVAWAEMLHDYTQRSGNLAVAVAQTFDGQHPCELCRTIALAKSKSHDPSPAAPSLKDDVKAKVLLAGPVFCLAICQPLGIALPRRASVFGPGRTEAPPTPPPRRLDYAV